MTKNIYKLRIIWPISFDKLNSILNTTNNFFSVFMENKEYYIETNSKEFAKKMEKYKIAILLNN